MRAVRASKIRGVQLAIVVDNKDGDGNPGYRVKLKFPWLSEQESTSWARIAIPMAGPGRGTYVLPEIDDQVLVVFEHGDIDRPIVIGAQWSKQQEPVEVNQSGKNNTKLIKSRSGHRIIFDDQEGAERITIVDRSRANKLVLDSVHKIVKLECSGEIEVIAKANVIMHANALKIGSSEGVTGKAASLLTHAAKTFGLKATRAITIGGGNTTINTSNAAATSVSGRGAGELGGGGADGGVASGQAAAGTGGATTSPARAAATPQPIAGSTLPTAAPASPEPMPPVVFAARWEKRCTRFSAAVTLGASCANAAGQTATFTVRPAGGGEPLATLTASCGDDRVETRWTTHAGPTPDRVIFEVAVADQRARSDELAFLVPVEGSIEISGAPAPSLKLKLIASDGTEHSGQTDARGQFRIEDVPAGQFRLSPDDDLFGDRD